MFVAFPRFPLSFIELVCFVCLVQNICGILLTFSSQSLWLQPLFWLLFIMPVLLIVLLSISLWPQFVVFACFFMAITSVSPQYFCLTKVYHVCYTFMLFLFGCLSPCMFLESSSLLVIYVGSYCLLHPHIARQLCEFHLSCVMPSLLLCGFMFVTPPYAACQLCEFLFLCLLCHPHYSSSMWILVAMPPHLLVIYVVGFFFLVYIIPVESFNTMNMNKFFLHCVHLQAF